MLPIPWDSLSALPGLPESFEPEDLRVETASVRLEQGRYVMDLKVSITPSTSCTGTWTSATASAVGTPHDVGCPMFFSPSQGASLSFAGATGDAAAGAALLKVFTGVPSIVTDTLHGEALGAGALPLASPAALLAATSAGQKSSQVCCHWKNKGWCRYQASCKFMHPEHKRGVGALPDTSSRNRRRQVSKQAAAGPAPLAGQAVRMLLRAPEQRRAAGDVAVTLWPPTVAHGQPMDGRCAATM